MNHLKTLVIAFAMALVSFGATSGTVYSSSDNCEAAAQAQLAEQYEPTMRAKGYGENRTKGLKLTPTEADGCHLMDTAVGKKWVFLKKSTPTLTRGARVVMLAECQNTIYESHYIQPKPQQASFEPGYTTIQVNKIIQRDEITVETVIKHVEICDDTTARPKTINGQLRCPEVTVHVPVNVVPDVKVTPRVVMTQPQVTAPLQPKAADCTDCGPAVKFDHKVARTDGRCVVAFKDPAGTVHYARFDTKRGTNLLVAARVDNESAEWNRSYTPTYVGYIANGEKKTVELTQPADCNAVYKAISHPSVLAWTGPRLGLTPDCIPAGRL